MSGPNDKRERIAMKFRGGEFASFGNVGNHAYIQMMIQHLSRHVARKHAMHADENAGMLFAETVERGQKRMDRAFVHANGDVAAFEAAQLANAFLDFLA